MSELADLPADRSSLRLDTYPVFNLGSDDKLNKWLRSSPEEAQTKAAELEFKPFDKNTSNTKWLKKVSVRLLNLCLVLWFKLSTLVKTRNNDLEELIYHKDAPHQYQIYYIEAKNQRVSNISVGNIVGA